MTNTYKKGLWPSGFSRLSALVGIFVLFLASSPARAVSPEFYQLLSDINGQLKTFTPTRGPACTPDLVDKVQNALQGELFTSAMNEVVVKSLESGAKTAASLLGAPGAAMTTYGIMRCAMEETTWQGFLRCAGGESAGGLLGEGTGKLFRDGELSKDLVGVALDRGWDEAFATARGAYEAYGSTSEEVSGTNNASGCTINYRFYWAKRGRPGARGGQILFHASVRDCDCRSANEVKAGHVRAIFDVVYASHGNSQPGWKVRPFRDLHVEAQCCNQRSYPDTSYLFSSTGRLIGKFTDEEPIDEPPKRPQTGGGTGDQTPGTDPGSSRPEPPAPKPPPPIRLPEPERVEYSRANPCPACVPIKQAIDEQARLIAALREQRSAKLTEKNDKLAEKSRLEKRIRLLESRLAGERGVGGEAFDPATGLTTSSYDTGDGRVRITVTDKDGNVVSERFRERDSSGDIQRQLDQAQADLTQTQADIEALDTALAELDAARAAAIAKYDNLQTALDDCINRLCRSYATCEQLLKHIQAYENAGLKDRSRALYNDLMRRAREMGCFDLEERQNLLFQQNYQLSSNRILISPPASGVSVKVIDVRPITGNNPFDERNPEAADANQVHDEPSSAPPSAGGGSGEDVLVVGVGSQLIPIRKLRVAGPDACASNHYHASSAQSCDGTFVSDPAPTSCGFGVVGSEFPIPLSSCQFP